MGISVTYEFACEKCGRSIVYKYPTHYGFHEHSPSNHPEGWKYTVKTERYNSKYILVCPECLEKK